MAEAQAQTQEAQSNAGTQNGVSVDGQKSPEAGEQNKQADKQVNKQQQAQANAPDGDGVNLTPEAENIRNLLSAVEVNPALANDPEIAKIIEGANKMAAEKDGSKPGQQTTKNEEEDEKKETQQEEQQESEEDSEESTDEETEKDEEEGEGEVEDEDVDDDETSGIFSSAPKSKVPEFSDFSDVVEYIYKQNNLKESDPKALEKYFNSVSKWRNDSKRLGESQTRLDEVESYFASLPEPLFQALNDYANGKEWQDSLNGQTLKIDFNKDFSNHSLYDIVNYYFPNEYKPEDLKDKDDAVVQKAVRFAEKQYNTDKRSFEQQRTEYERQAQLQQKNLASSVDSSVKKLKDAFPDFNTNTERKVRKLMSAGNVTSLFYNSDGTYKDDAAEKLVMAIYGKQEIDRLVKKASRKAESKATEQVVSRASDKPTSKKKQEVPTATTEENIMKHFKELFPSKTY